MRALSSISAEAFFMELLNMAILATWVMLAVILFRAILKRWLPRRIIIWGWALVAFRLACPYTIESVLSLIPVKKPIPPDIPYAQIPMVNMGIPFIDRPVNNLLLEHMTPAPEASVNPLQIVFFVACMVWLAGVAILLIYTAVSYFILRRRMRMAIKLSDGEVTTHLPKSVTLWMCDRVQSPFILGIVRPRIYLPHGMDAETTAHVLAHETTHLRRGDHITKLLAFLLCTVYWFHPLVWVCYVLYCRDMEAACDERVIRDMDDATRRSYAKALLSCASDSHPRPFCPPAFGESDVKSRIKGVLSYKKPLLWLSIVALLILAVIGVVLLTDPAEEPGCMNWTWPNIQSYPVTPVLEGLDVTPVNVNYSEQGWLTSVEMELVNHTGENIGYGEPFRIYREENREWVDAEMIDTVFHLPMYMLADGEETRVTYDVSHYDLSTPGIYMLTFSVTYPINEYGATKDYEIRWIFRVMDTNLLATTPPPADFAIKFESQTGKAANILDTFDGYIQKDLVAATPNTAQTEFIPTESQLQYLWYLVEFHGITSMPSDMHPIQMGDTAVDVSPNTEYTITIRANGRTYTVRGDTVTGMVAGEKNKQFQSFVGEMMNFMYSTSQWHMLPDAEGGYM